MIASGCCRRLAANHEEVCGWAESADLMTNCRASKPVGRTRRRKCPSGWSRMGSLRKTRIDVTARHCLGVLLLSREKRSDKATCGYASKYETSVSFQLRWNVEFPLGAVPPLWHCRQCLGTTGSSDRVALNVPRTRHGRFFYRLNYNATELLNMS